MTYFQYQYLHPSLTSIYHFQRKRSPRRRANPKRKKRPNQWLQTDYRHLPVSRHPRAWPVSSRQLQAVWRHPISWNCGRMLVGGPSQKYQTLVRDRCTKSSRRNRRRSVVLWEAREDTTFLLFPVELRFLCLATSGEARYVLHSSTLALFLSPLFSLFTFSRLSLLSHDRMIA